MLYGLRTLTPKHVFLRVPQRTTYLDDPENTPRVPSHRHTADVSASPQKRPSSRHQIWMVPSFLFHQTIMLSFASLSWGTTVPEPLGPNQQAANKGSKMTREVYLVSGTPHLSIISLSAIDLLARWPLHFRKASKAVSKQHFTGWLWTLGRWGGANVRGKEPCPRSSLHRRGRGCRYRADSGGQVTVEDAGGC